MSGGRIGELVDELAALGRELHRQDNRAHLVYHVTQRHRTYGVDVAYRDPDGYWVHSPGEPSDGEHVAVDAVDGVDEGLVAAPYVDDRRVVEGCVALTEKGAAECLERHRHDLDDPKICVGSAHQVPEMIRLREILLQLADLAGPPIIRRAEWGADPYRGEPVRMLSPSGIVVHHSADRYVDSLEDSAREVRWVQRVHQHNKGWSDVGYHYLIDGAGNIFRGRPMIDGHHAVGAHVAGQNATEIGVCLLGNYEPTEPDARQEVSRGALDALVDLSAFLCRSYRIAIDAILGHRDLAATLCPGETLYGQLGTCRRLVAKRLYEEK